MILMKLNLVFLLIVVALAGCTNRSHSGTMSDTELSLRNTPQYGRAIGPQLDAQRVR